MNLSTKLLIKKQRTIELCFQELDTYQSHEDSQRARVEQDTTKVVAKATPEGVQTGQYGFFNWLKELYSFSPDTTEKSYPELAQLAIDHYYRMPHPDQAEQFAVSQQPIPDLLRQSHGVDHVTRTQIFSEAFLEIFSKYDQTFRDLLDSQPELLELIPLAMVYHDVTAELEDKLMEEIKAAEFYQRDMHASRRYSSDNITLVSSALLNKESDVIESIAAPFTPDTSCSPQERIVRRILRLADRTDVVRITEIPEGWKQHQNVSRLYCFDSRLLDLPETVSAGFQEDLDALLEGAKDLAYVTGGMPRSDFSKSGSYLKRYNLLARNHKRRLKIARAVNAYDSVKTALDDNVRRKIASFAGLFSCQADHTQKTVLSHNPACLKEKNDREYLAAIHSELELRQVRLSERMTILQKMLFEQRGLECLPQNLREEAQREIDRLKEKGIQPPLGTLTQETLRNPLARKRLRLDYGLDVISEDRFCGWLENGKALYDTFFVTRPTEASSSGTTCKELPTL